MSRILRETSKDSIKSTGWLETISRVPPYALISAFIIALYLVVGLGATWIAPYGEAEIASPDPFAPWSAKFLLGTDQLGRDMLSRMLFAIRNTIGIALVTTIVSFSIGVTLGILAALRRGWFDEIVSRVVDILMAIPALIFALILLSMFGSSILNLILVMALLDSTRSFRLARATAMNVTAMDFIEVAGMRGERTPWMIFHEILPNIASTLMAEFALRFCFVFLSISALSFLGLGIQQPTADLGSMVRDSAALIAYGDTTVLVPAALIAVLAIAVNFLADWLIVRASGLKEG